MSTLGRFGLTERRQGGLVRLLQLVMVGILAVGAWLGNLGVVVNAGVGLLVTLLPAYLERNYQFTMAVGLVLWLTVAMFLHALGTLPLPTLDFLSLYKTTWWWDHMTHALSSSLVVGAGYAVVRALDEHSEAISLPPRFVFVYLLVFVMAFGVVWELLEFYLGLVGRLLATGAILTQYGLTDTVLDLVYNTVGGLLVALFGTFRLTGVAEELAARLDRRSEGR